MPEGEKRRRGRPPKRPGASKRSHLTFRLTDALKARLSTASRQSNRSISEEIESRLERSFDRETVAEELFGTEEATGILKAASAIVSHVDRFLVENLQVTHVANGKEKTDLANGLLISAALVRFLEALNDLSGGEIVALATAHSSPLFDAGLASQPNPDISRDAAIAVTAQTLGETLAKAAARVDKFSG